MAGGAGAGGARASSPAFGLLAAAIEHHHARTLPGARRRRPTSTPSTAAWRELDAAGRARMREEGVPADAGARGVRRRHALRRPGVRAGGADRGAASRASGPRRRSWPPSTRSTSACTATRARSQPVEFVNFRAVHTCPLPRPVVTPAARATGTLADARLGERRGVLRAGGFVPTPIYERARLPLGARLAGPAIVEQPRHDHRDPARRAPPWWTTPGNLRACRRAHDARDRPDPARGAAQPAGRHRRRDGADAPQERGLADREGGARRLRRALQHRRARPSPRRRRSPSTSGALAVRGPAARAARSRRSACGTATPSS